MLMLIVTKRAVTPSAGCRLWGSAMVRQCGGLIELKKATLWLTAAAALLIYAVTLSHRNGVAFLLKHHLPLPYSPRLPLFNSPKTQTLPNYPPSLCVWPLVIIAW